MKTKSLAQVVTGLVVLSIGVGFLLDALHIMQFSSIMAVWWPLLIIIVGILSLISNPRAPLWPLAIVVFGTLILLKQFNIVTFSVWELIWPSLIILAGVSILFERVRERPKAINDATIDAVAIFSGQEIRNASSVFKGGATTAVFGGVDLDLRDAKLADGAVLTAFVAFGGVDLKVPEGWRVKVSGLPIFGGWEDKTRKPTDGKNAPTLTISGTCIFGGVSVKN